MMNRYLRFARIVKKMRLTKSSIATTMKFVRTHSSIGMMILCLIGK
jgi:hypothetical protein